jgi:hypothetical protein
MMKSAVAITLVLIFLATACGGAPASPPAAPEMPTVGAVSVPAVTPEDQESTSDPVAEPTTPAEGPQPTSTVNPRLHATNPQDVKLASGDQPTLVEFFAFW